jgi:hypothetical protein
MKSTNQVRNNRGIKPTSSQVKTPQHNGQKTITVVFKEAETGKESFRAEFSGPEFAPIKRVCERANITQEQFFQIAIGSQIANLEAKYDNFKPAPGIHEVEIDECAALMILKDGVSVGHIVLTDEQFTRLHALTKGSSPLLTLLLKQALARMLTPDKGGLELEQAKNQILTLMELLVQTLLGETSGFQSAQNRTGALGAGLVDLVHAATVRLENAFNLAENAAHGQLEEVAS